MRKSGTRISATSVQMRKSARRIDEDEQRPVAAAWSEKWTTRPLALTNFMGALFPGARGVFTDDGLPDDGKLAASTTLR